MKAVLAETEQKRHYPPSYLVNGVMEANPERPERVELLLQGVKDAGLDLVRPENYDAAPILAVHSKRYLDFLARAHERWARIPGASEAVTPNVHPLRRGGYPASVVAQAGWHMIDASAPISADTWESAQWSAWTAAHAAKLVLQGERAAYALCRPPGHHAGAETAGGFCYLNNTAIAAEVLRKDHDRVAILDVDLHHGNGTQDIFYNRGDVLTVSIHADPVRFYPFFWGYADETGEDGGDGANLNLPLPRGSKDDAFLDALGAALKKIEDFGPDALVIALGLDAYEGDPIAGLAVTSGGFARIGEAIGGALKLPTVIIQEGGYPCDELGSNLAAFLGGHQSRR
ncbi:histone deacetylase family protein [Hyphococcus luteus]|uniref:Acetylpolyamine amidohydrolase n=1 Tax=Hyphococcus luteus TaxID=2058213 RepID=A0A2S7K9Z6_9PROT|nr:histone deacetylase family protein [Marinicaulis flavus]PQA89344.1 acetylpolyamine amidohydrolase [Marinicaulis flavus]